MLGAPRLATSIATALLLASSFTLSSRAARAESQTDVEQARRFFMEGTKLAQQGSWAEARESFERSLTHKRAAITLYSLGVAQRASGALVQARESFRAFLAEPSGAATVSYERPAKDAIEELEREVGRLRIVLAPPSPRRLTVEVDGVPQSRDALAAPLLVNPGLHRVRAAARAWGELTIDVVVASGATERVRLRLVGPTPFEASSAEPDEEPPRVSRAVPFTLLGVGAVTLATGVVLGVAGMSQAGAASPTDSATLDTARTKAVVGDVVGGVGIAAMAVGVGALLFTPRAPRSVTIAPHVAPFVSATTGGIVGAF